LRSCGTGSNQEGVLWLHYKEGLRQARENQRRKKNVRIQDDVLDEIVLISKIDLKIGVRVLPSKF
jgi:hypothetical protein